MAPIRPTSAENLRNSVLIWSSAWLTLTAFPSSLPANQSREYADIRGIVSPNRRAVRNARHTPSVLPAAAVGEEPVEASMSPADFEPHAVKKIIKQRVR